MKMKIPADDDYNTTQDNTTTYSLISDHSDSSSASEETDPPTLDGDFSEYMWMENEEEFEKQVYITFSIIIIIIKVHSIHII